MAFLVVREKGFTVQCLVSTQSEGVSRQMVRFVAGINRESIVDVIGVVSVPGNPIKGATLQVDILVRKLYCVNKAMPTLPINIEDAARSDVEIETSLQDTRLNFRVLDIRTPANQGIFRIQCQVGTLDYKGQPAYLAQSPQLHKQMSICGDFGRVFENGPVFRAEDSYTHRHLCEFTGLDVEIEIRKHYSEYKPNTLRFTFAEGVQMLKDAGVEVDPLGDLNTETERKLGQLVLEKYGTEFYILHRYPLAVRPFYTMPCYDNSLYSNSFDVFIRGEEIISGAQRVHVPEFLAEHAQACGIDVNTISTYIDSFRYGAPPHGGFGVGLERVVMLFCGLGNIRKPSLFPRDPRRIAP
ncbi:hypothetical protein CRYUN_Cryun03dG0063600 [Craigia yunnanensis]